MTASFHTLGCKVNQYETQSLRELFSNNGYTVTQSETADVIVINSCTVTSLADRKSRQLLRRLRRAAPEAIIVMTGCMPQTSPGEAYGLMEADIVTGTKNKAEILSLVEDFKLQKTRKLGVTSHEKKDKFDEMTVSNFSESFQKAYLKIEDGCDCYCSYCIIPFARGAVRSRSIESIKKEVEKLSLAGYKEIILTGINLSRYGAKEGKRLPDAIGAACEINPELRIRLGSVEPVLIAKEDYDKMSKHKNLCPHFHLALQSGCDETLKRMGRRYTTGEYRETVEYIFKTFPNPSITTDIIVGFPGETDEEFLETCEFVKSFPLLRAHIFEYSVRAGTKAATMENQVSPQVKKQRARILTDICQAQGKNFCEGQVGVTTKVLWEATGVGYSDNYVLIKPFGPPPKAGEISPVIITQVYENGCIAII